MNIDLTSSRAKKCVKLLSVTYNLPINRIVEILSKPRVFQYEWDIKCSLLANPRSFDMYNLICARLVGNLTDVFSSEVCNPTSRIISENLIKVSALKIFTNPEKCFLEIIVNSIDAHRKGLYGDQAPSIGKFGMGFISIMYYILTYNAKLFIASKYKSESGEMCSWGIEITNVSGKLHCELLRYIFPQNNTGVIMKLFILKKYSKDISKYVKNAIESISIESSIKFVKNYPKNTTKQRYILYRTDPDQVNKRMIAHTFADNDGGISLSTLFGSMLLPSSSTKKMSTLAANQTTVVLENYSRVENLIGGGYRSILIISVGGIPVLDFNALSPDNVPNLKFIIDLPISTSVPVARDDIILDGESSEKLREYIIAIINLIVTHYKEYLQLFFTLLDMYALKTEVGRVFDIIDECKSLTLSRKDIVFIPDIKLASVLKIPNLQVVYFENVNILDTSTKLHTFLSVSHSTTPSKNNVIYDNIINSKYLVILDEEYPPSSGKIPSFLFIGRTYITTDWKSNILSSYTTSQLTFTSENTLSNILDIIKKYNPTRLVKIHPSVTNVISESILVNLFETLVKKKEVYGRICNIDPVTVFDEIIRCISYLVEVLSPDVIRKYISDLINFISEIKVRVVYAGNPIITMINVYLSFTILNKYIDEFGEYSPEMKVRIQNIIVEVLYDSMYISTAATRFGFEDCNIVLFDKKVLWIAPRVRSDILNFTLTLSELIVEYQTSNIEGMFVGHSINNSMDNSDKYNMSSVKLGRVVRYVFQEYRSRYGREFTNYYRNYCLTNHEVPLFNNVIKVLTTIIKLYINSISRVGITKDNIFPRKYSTIFTTEKLLSFVFKHPIPNTLSEYNIVRDDMSSDKLQIVKIAANAGTSKEFIPSVLTELVQNSIDAIKSTGIKGSVSIEFGMVDTHSGQRNYILVSDPVGIDFKNLPSLMIPFYSSKSVSGVDNELTGEMGTGFFNVFRQPFVEKVYIYTSSPNTKGISVCATPIIHNNLIQDIEWSMIPVKRKFTRGTEMYIILNASTESIDIETNVSIFVRGKLSGINTVDILYNSELITEKYNTIHSCDTHEIRINTSTSSPSMIYTNGIPFMELLLYIKRNYKESLLLPGISSGVIIDLRKKAYSSTQSRTNITGGDKLKNIIYTSVFLAVMYKYVTENTSEYYSLIPHMNSTADPNQLRIGSNEQSSSNNIINFVNIVNYNYGIFLIGKYKTIATEINRVIPLVENDGKYLEKLSIEPVEQNIYSIIMTWFSNKKYSPNAGNVSKVLSISNGQGISSSDKKYTDLLKVYKLFVKEFWVGLLEINFSPSIKPNPPKVIFAVINELNGFYTPSSHSITMNMKIIPVDELINSMKNILKTFKSSGIIQGISLLNSLDVVQSHIGNQKQAVVLVHELFHAIRNDSHQGSHGSFQYTIGNNIPKNLEFDDAIFDIYTCILSGGLWDRILTKLQKIL